jgi:hypothetical protein
MEIVLEIGGLKHSKARLTIAMARSTPAQKPRGLANTISITASKRGCFR